MAKKKTETTAKKTTKGNASRTVLLSAVKGDSKSMQILEQAVRAVQKQDNDALKDLAKATRKLKSTRQKLAQARLSQSKTESSIQSRMRDAAKAAGVLKDLEVKPKAKKKSAPVVESFPEETEQQQSDRLKQMIARSLSERKGTSGTTDPDLRKEQDARDARRMMLARQVAAKKRIGGKILGRDPYASAAEEMKSGAVEQEGFVPNINRPPADRKNALAGGGNILQELERIKKFMGTTPEDSVRESKTSSTYSTSTGEGEKKRSAKATKDASTDVKAAKKIDTLVPGSAVPVVVTPTLNEPLFAAMSGVQRRMVEGQATLNEKIEQLSANLKRDPIKEKLQDSKEDKWQDDVLNELRSPNSKRKNEDDDEKGPNIFSKLMGSGVGSVFKFLAPLLGVAAFRGVVPKIGHKIKGVGLGAQGWLANLMGNERWAANVRQQQEEHNKNDPGPIGMGEGIVSSMMALWGGRKLYKMAKGGIKAFKGSKGLISRLMGRQAVRTGAGAAFEGVALSAGRSAAAKGLIRGLVTRMGARFLATQAVGSVAPGVGNIVMGIAAAAWTIGDIAWTLMSDEQKAAVKKAIGSAWEATKETAAELGAKIMEWGRQAVGYMKDLWNNEELGTNFVRDNKATAAAANKEYSHRRAIDDKGRLSTAGDVHKEALRKDPGYGAKVKAERDAAESQGKGWSLENSAAYKELMEKNMHSNLGQGYQSNTDPNLEKANQQQLISATYEAFRKAGLSHEGALAHTAEIGRENSFNPETMFGYHKDPHKGVNVGMMSWQGDRGKKLEQFLMDRGLMKDGKILRGKASLDAMAQFSVDEMQNGSKAQKKTLDYLQSDNIDPTQAMDMLGRNHIKWRIDDPRYRADGLRNRSQFYSKAQRASTITMAQQSPVTAALVTPTARIEPQQGIYMGGQGMITPTYEPKPEPLPTPVTTEDNGGRGSAYQTPMPAGARNAPGLYQHSFIEDAGLQLLNQLNYA